MDVVLVGHRALLQGKSASKKMGRRKNSVANLDSACPICMDQTLQVGIWKCGHKVTPPPSTTTTTVRPTVGGWSSDYS